MKNSKRELTPFGIATLQDRYLLPNEAPSCMFYRVSKTYGDNPEHAERLRGYMERLWFMPSTPILSNGGAERGLPISCFLNEVSDSLEGIVEAWNENVWLAAKGGGIGTYWGNLRSIGEGVAKAGHTTGIVPFIKVMDAQTLAISQGSLRRGSAAVYLPIHHPEIEEFIEIRRPTGGDPNRKALNIHHGVVISDKFMSAVQSGQKFDLVSPHSGAVIKTVDARALWIRLLTARIETGEPYILFEDAVRRATPEHHKKSNLFVKTSNLCSEITLPTSQYRSAVCCLSSLNLEYFDEWKDDAVFIEDVMRFLDNVLEDFIKRAPYSMHRASYGASQERSVGLGVMGFHSLLQSLGIPFESALSKSINLKVSSHIKAQADAASIKLAKERGACPDAAHWGVTERFSYKIAIAPTASISIICGGTSPGIEPYVANSYTHKTLSGSFTVRNKHLEKVLEAKGLNNEKTWQQISARHGSVQWIPDLDRHEKDVFKTAMEINNRWIIDLAADRQPYVCQSQSVNIFLPADISKKELHDLHMEAWSKGLKSLYYCRSQSSQRAESAFINGDALPASGNGEDCLACQ